MNFDPTAIVAFFDELAVLLEPFMALLAPVMVLLEPFLALLAAVL